MNINTSLRAKSISYGGTRATSAIKYIVYHYTGNETDTAKANANYFATSNKRKAGAHYFVDTGSTIYQSIPDTKVAYAVGVNYGGRLFGTVTNANSISIEMCSQNGAIPEATIKNAVKLGKLLMKKYGINISHVVRHYDVCAKECPGWYGWYGGNSKKWEALKAALQENDEFPAKTIANVKVHTSAKAASETIRTLDEGTRFTVVDETPNWYKMEGGGYVPKKDCAYRIKTTDELNIRKLSNAKSAIIGKLGKGEKTWIIAEEGHWGKRQKGGYINLNYTEKA